MAPVVWRAPGADRCVVSMMNGQSKLSGLQVTDVRSALPIDISRLQPGAEAATRRLLGKVRGGRYKLAIRDAGVSDAAGLASDQHIVQSFVADTAQNIQTGLDTLYRLRSRLHSIRQTDGGMALALTQIQMYSRASVLAKLTGGYTVNVTT
jgi:hypothetical protein